jgi:hypothetical protein
MITARAGKATSPACIEETRANEHGEPTIYFFFASRVNGASASVNSTTFSPVTVLMSW